MRRYEKIEDKNWAVILVEKKFIELDSLYDELEIARNNPSKYPKLCLLNSIILSIISEEENNQQNLDLILPIPDNP